jgi:hypothetical protein
LEIGKFHEEEGIMMNIRRAWSLVSLSMLVLILATYLPAQDQATNNGDNLTEQQKEEFLNNAKVISSSHTSKGVTEPWRLTLSDGTITHQAGYQTIDEMKPQMQFADGHTEFNFKDSYRFNIAGYELAKLVGLDDMVPVTVDRRWNGMKGSLSWWVSDVAMDEGERMEKNVSAPDPDAWNKQMYKIRVFDELVFDTDPNLTNVLITKDWKIWRVDFSRAFRTYKKLRKADNLVMCDKNLFEKLKALDEPTLKASLGKIIAGSELKAILARRDEIVATFNKMIAEKGEAAVLY